MIEKTLRAPQTERIMKMRAPVTAIISCLLVKAHDKMATIPSVKEELQSSTPKAKTTTRHACNRKLEAKA